MFIYLYSSFAEKNDTSQKFSFSVLSALCATQGGNFRKKKFTRVTA